jgi:hypothetical protein
MSLLCYEMDIGSGVLVCVFLKYCNCVKLCSWNELLVGFSVINMKFQCIGPSWVLAAIGALCDLGWFSWRVLLVLVGWLSSRVHITMSSLWLLWV